jgi:hypothetical protein
MTTILGGRSAYAEFRIATNEQQANKQMSVLSNIINNCSRVVETSTFLIIKATSDGARDSKVQEKCSWQDIGLSSDFVMIESSNVINNLYLTDSGTNTWSIRGKTVGSQ